MTVNINTFFSQQYGTAVETLLQQKQSKLRSLVRVEGHNGAKQAAPINQVGQIEGRKVTTRFDALGRTDADTQRVWVVPSDYDIPPQMVDQFDALKTLNDPKNAFSENAASAINRLMDDAIIDAAFATMVTGETATGTQAFDTTNHRVAVQYGAAGDTNLTVVKIIHGRKIMQDYQVDFAMEGDPFLVINPLAEESLLREPEVTSTDFNSKPVLVDGRVVRFCGCNIVISTRLDLDATDTDSRRIILGVKSGLYLGVWKEMTNTVSQRNDLTSHPWQLYTMASFGATRTQAGKIIDILCDE